MLLWRVRWVFLSIFLPKLIRIIAHKAAYLAGVLHRDISPGNILIFGKDEWGDSNDEREMAIKGGMLIDWDLSKITCENHQGSTTRRHTRTVSRLLEAILHLTEMSSRQGTWQFMAGDLTADPKIQQTFAHDLESFFWVLLWIVLTRVQNGSEDRIRSSFIHGTMNPRIFKGSGGPNKKLFLTSSLALGEVWDGFSLPENEPLFSLLVELKGTVGKRYLPSEKLTVEPDKKTAALAIAGRVNQPDSGPNAVGAAASNSEMLGSYEAVTNVFSDALSSEGWPSSDKAEAQIILQSSSSVRASHSGSKRSRSAIETEPPDGDQSSRKRRG
jgi:serine/threonine protein kinase